MSHATTRTQSRGIKAATAKSLPLPLSKKMEYSDCDEADKLCIVVLMGGPSSEHEVSLATGRKIIEALDPAKYLVKPLIVSRDRRWLSMPREFFLAAPAEERSLAESLKALVPESEAKALSGLANNRQNVIFIAMHGEFGEDGTVQGLLESADIAYTGSGVLASALGMDKIRSAALFREAGLTIPDFTAITRDSLPGLIRANSGMVEAADYLGLPLVVKPADRGSSVGVSIVREASKIHAAAEEALRHSPSALLQKYIAGTEVTCGVLETPAGAIPLQPTAIIPKEREFFDYHSKYIAGATDEITPPNLPAEIIREIQEAALKAHHALGCSGMSRTDMILDAGGNLYVLELNTIPGMTQTSLLPQAAAAVGISFPELLDCIIASARKRKINSR